MISASPEPGSLAAATATLLDTFAPGTAISFYEAQIALSRSWSRAEAALAMLVAGGQLAHPADDVWVRVGAAAEPPQLAARIVSPYALAGLTALALHGRSRSWPREVTIYAARDFAPFEYNGVRYRRLKPRGAVEAIWIRLPGASALAGVASALGFPSTPAVVSITDLDQTLIDCARPAVVDDAVRQLRNDPTVFPSLDRERLLSRARRVGDHAGDPALVTRLARLLELIGVVGDQSPNSVVPSWQ
jgi:hypothetical protein